MINLSSSAVIAVYDDGTRRSFEFDELQSRLYQSCLSCGINDGSFAEDITLSVEYVLKKISAGGRIFTVSEINSFVVRMLEEAGYPEIGENFTIRNKVRRIDVKPDLELISGIISKHLGIEGDELQAISRKVISSCEMLGMEKASPSLVLELARHYRENAIDLKSLSLGPRNMKSQSPWCVRSDEIIASVSFETRKLVTAGALTSSHVSRLFPSLKIDMNLASSAGYFALEKQVTELAILPCFQSCATGINEIAVAARGLYGNYLGSNGYDGADAQLPVFLRLNEIAAFSEGYLCSKWPESHVCVGEMAAMLAGMLEGDIAVRELPSFNKS
ncbi:MAG TPA: hypothetical protein DCZ94_19700 [Lentisphaeria bacterium]|nr:MAG: hypothetical protein A2X48_22460 [Lentisphaerae bacterium GWF2_49_21]HBC89170.1 hypothetical protein [Lentisphaeria bacterium]